MARKPVQDFFLFLLGSGLFAAGIFLFTSQVSVGSGFGLLMIPFAVGVALLLAGSLRRLGWFLI
jgi:hypothetical protein